MYKCVCEGRYTSEGSNIAEIYKRWILVSALALREDSASKTAEAEWKEKAKKELEDWHVHQNEQMEKNKANNRLVVMGRLCICFA